MEKGIKTVTAYELMLLLRQHYNRIYNEIKKSTDLINVKFKNMITISYDKEKLNNKCSLKMIDYNISENEITFILTDNHSETTTEIKIKKESSGLSNGQNFTSNDAIELKLIREFKIDLDDIFYTLEQHSYFFPKPQMVVSNNELFLVKMSSTEITLFTQTYFVKREHDSAAYRIVGSPLKTVERIKKNEDDFFKKVSVNLDELPLWIKQSILSTRTNDLDNQISHIVENILLNAEEIKNVLVANNISLNQINMADYKKMLGYLKKILRRDRISKNILKYQIGSLAFLTAYSTTKAMVSKNLNLTPDFLAAILFFMITNLIPTYIDTKKPNIEDLFEKNKHGFDLLLQNEELRLHLTNIGFLLSNNETTKALEYIAKITIGSIHTPKKPKNRGRVFNIRTLK